MYLNKMIVIDVTNTNYAMHRRISRWLTSKKKERHALLVRQGYKDYIIPWCNHISHVNYIHPLIHSALWCYCTRILKYEWIKQKPMSTQTLSVFVFAYPYERCQVQGFFLPTKVKSQTIYNCLLCDESIIANGLSTFTRPTF